MERATVKCNVQSTWRNFLEALYNIRVLGEIEGFDAGFTLSESETFGYLIDADDATCTLELRPLGNALSDGAKTLSWRKHLQVLVVD